MRRIFERVAVVALLVGAALAYAIPAAARLPETDPDYKDLQELAHENLPLNPLSNVWNGRVATPTDVPDVYGPGAVLTVGNVFMKVTNFGFDGNPTVTSSDPSGQWPGYSGVEYLNFLSVAVGAVNPFATDPTAVRRVSYSGEWRPATLEPEDRIYRTYEGAPKSTCDVNDDHDKDPLTGDDMIDEDILDGRDNDGDGLIDEDFCAHGQEMFSMVMRDDTPQAVAAGGSERHVPLGLEMRKTAWTYSIDGYKDFNVISFDIYNRSGHVLDSVVIGWRDDMDCGPTKQAGYWTDDYNLPYYPHGDFMIDVQSPSAPKHGDLRLQPASDQVTPVTGFSKPDSALCPRYKVRVLGWSVRDDDGDEGLTHGIGTIQLIDHTIDPLGKAGPATVGLRAFRSYTNSSPYVQGGPPSIDQQRYEFMTGHDNIDQDTGWITATQGEQKGDYGEWSSIGPWLNFPPNGHITATIAFGVAEKPDKLHPPEGYPEDYAAAVDPTVGAVTSGITSRDRTKLLDDYPSLANALTAQVAFAGTYEKNSIAYPWVTTGHGRETRVQPLVGQTGFYQGCQDHDQDVTTLTYPQVGWFDYDCDFCTGAYSKLNGGLYHRTWVAASPPPSPNVNTAASYNYSDNPDRRFPPAQDGQVLLAWDNLSETSPDPQKHEFDFRGYRVWKVSNWVRPVGATGPYEDDWTLLHEYRLFDSAPTNAIKPCPPESIGPGKPCAATGDTLWPLIYFPNSGVTKRFKLYSGDLYDRQSGEVLRPDPTVKCTGWPNCQTVTGKFLGRDAETQRTKYPVGRYQVVDTQVKNGFLYFYSVTAFDSTGLNITKNELQSSRSAIETDAVVPQASADSVSGGKRVWVVPNPYRGVRQIAQRPSSWDLTPNASDPTGTHIDFFGLPRGEWKIKIFTVSGDHVATLDSHDAVNESIRPAITDANGASHPGYNRQADNANDGQARWNLISRNGQDVVSGIYIFTVEVGGSVRHRGKFVIIR